MCVCVCVFKNVRRSVRHCYLSELVLETSKETTPCYFFLFLQGPGRVFLLGDQVLYGLPVSIGRLCPSVKWRQIVRFLISPISRGKRKCSSGMLFGEVRQR